ncbi:MAG: YggT family protein [Clostridia bacterium]|nr:MAG: YggT family protein [Clostridia bacterium]
MYFVVQVIHIIFQMMELLVLVRVVLSWFPVSRGNILTDFIYEVTEPVLRPFRRWLAVGPVDFSPFAAMLVLYLVERVVIQVVLTL